MANDRSLRVAEAIRREVGELLISGLKDSRLKGGVISITNVDVTRDLRHVKIFISVLGDEEKKKDVMDGLESAKGFVRSEVGQRVKLRFTPEIHFKLDESIEKGSKILALMDQIKSEDTEPLT